MKKRGRGSAAKNDSIASYDYEKRRHSSALESNPAGKGSITGKPNMSPKTSSKDVDSRNGSKFGGKDKLKKYNTSKEKMGSGFGTPAPKLGANENGGASAQKASIGSRNVSPMTKRRGTNVDPLTSKDRASFNRKAQQVQNLKPISTVSRQRNHNSERTEAQSTMTQQDLKISQIIYYDREQPKSPSEPAKDLPQPADLSGSGKPATTFDKGPGPLAESQRVVQTELQSSEGILVSGEVVNSHASSIADDAAPNKVKVAAPVV